MHKALERVLGEAKLIAIAAAIALGYALLEVSDSVGRFVLQLFDKPDSFGGGGDTPLTIHLGNRNLSFDALLSASVSFAVVVVAVAFVLGRSGRRR